MLQVLSSDFRVTASIPSQQHIARSRSMQALLIFRGVRIVKIKRHRKFVIVVQNAMPLAVRHLRFHNRFSEKLLWPNAVMGIIVSFMARGSSCKGSLL